MYLAQTTPSIIVTDNNAKEGPDGVDWDSGVWKYTVNDAHNAPANVQVYPPADYLSNSSTYAQYFFIHMHLLLLKWTHAAHIFPTGKL
jgi:hypothetical protein